MPVWDCHTDILSKLLVEPLEGFCEGRSGGDFRHYDLPRLKSGGVGVMVCALFSRDDTAHEHPAVRTLRMIDIAYRLQALTDRRVEIATDSAAIDRITGEGRTAIVLSIENAIACLDRLELLRTYHRLGVRAIGLAWNGRNYAVDGCFVEDAGSKITPFGRALVAEMERLGMVVDVSHLSLTCFWDLMERIERPPIASHSNARSLCDHRRNLHPDQVRAIAERGGVIGVNFWEHFLRLKGEGRATADDVVRHTLRLIEEAGEDHVGIGTDYDGIDYGPDGAGDPSDFPALRERLEAAGVTGPALDKVLFGNFRRVFGEVIG